MVAGPTHESPRELLPGWTPARALHYQDEPAELEAQTLRLGQARRSSLGALVVDTGRFCGRSPKDRYIVEDACTRQQVDWNEINQSLDTSAFLRLEQDLRDYLQQRELWIRDAALSADPRYRLQVRVISELPWACLFVHHLLRSPEPASEPEQRWTLLHAPGLRADPARHGCRAQQVVAISMERSCILICGTAYTGEIKKSLFSVMNLLLPQRQVLPMHCAANTGADGDTALFFGLSGTGKTSLSSDPQRRLIGDDEHGWSPEGIFNLEGGCYAKCLNLDPLEEPAIYAAIQKGALLENVGFVPGTDRVDFSDAGRTENTRASYPLEHIPGVEPCGRGASPKHVFFLTCDAFGVLPPLARLTQSQAMYHFVSGYTAKVAGTETGIAEPQAAFSACYGAPFMPLDPLVYARLLGERLRSSSAECWLLNTGWSGGGYGRGTRMPLSCSRALVRFVLSGDWRSVSFHTHPLYSLAIPGHCPGVSGRLLDAVSSWEDPGAYRNAALDLARRFRDNFARYEARAAADIRAGALL